MTSPIESIGNARRNGLLLLLVTFAAGAVVGAGIMRVGSAAPASVGGPPGRPSLMPGGPGGGLPPFVAERLGLTDAQRSKIEAILSAARPRSDSMLVIMMPRLKAIADSTRVAVEAVLTTEQRAMLNELQQQRGPGGPPWLR